MNFFNKSFKSKKRIKRTIKNPNFSTPFLKYKCRTQLEILFNIFLD